MEDLLTSRGVRPTANRLLVARALSAAERPMALSDLEGRLAPMDKSSIFRALTALLSHHVLHSVDDGTGMLKYELCPSPHEHHAADGHAHFHCSECGKTFCLDDVHIPMPALPDGYAVAEINYVLRGTCPRCTRRLALHA